MSQKKSIVLCIVLVTLALLAVPTAPQALSARAIEASLPAQQALGTSSQLGPDAPAVIHTVNNNGDGSDANPGDGVCETATGNGICTLRAAMEEAKAFTGYDTINFDNSVTVITPNSPLPNVNDFTGGTTIRGNPTWILGSFAGTMTNGFVLGSNYNKLQGLIITNFGASGVLVKGDNNIIGTDGDGVDDATEGNVLSSNSNYGAYFRDNATGNWLAGNLIGTNFDGTAAAGNGLDGVMIEVGAHSNRIGTNGDGASDELERNVISGNDENGIKISDDGVDQNTIAGNYIGINAAGDSAIPNTENGLSIVTNSANNLVGTDGDGTADEAERNVISGNGKSGIRLSNTTGNVVAGNFVGTNAVGDAALPNDDRGVYILASSTDNLIGTDADGTADDLERNVISGNEDEGIYLLNPGTESNVVAGNYIGTNAGGNAAISNRYGVKLGVVGNNRIGGTSVVERNVISGNDIHGIHFDQATRGNLVQGNYIGTDASGSGNLGNGSHGVSVFRSVGTLIGGIVSGAANRIAFNGKAGILIYETSPSEPCNDNRLQGNAVFFNGHLGIDLFPSDATPNDSGDGDTGSNNLQNYPVLSSAVSDGSQIIIQGTLNSNSDTTYNLEFYLNSSCDPSGYGEGEIYLGADTVATDGSGDASFTAALLNAVLSGYHVTATATDPDGNTSEFSQCRIVTAPCTPVYDADFDRAPTTPAIGQQATFDAEAVGSLPITYTWDFGDGTGGAGSTVPQTYNATGDYTVVMTATNQCGTEVVSHTLTVVENPVCTSVQIEAATTDISGCEVNFAADLYGDTPFVYAWDFGDGKASTLATPHHTFASTGAHMVTLQVSNCADVGSDSHTFPVHVECLSPGYKILLPIIYRNYGG